MCWDAPLLGMCFCHGFVAFAVSNPVAGSERVLSCRLRAVPIPCLWVSWLHPGWVPMQYPIAEAQAATCHIPAHGVRPDTGWDVLVLCLSHSSSTLPIGFHRIREWFELKGTFRGHLIQSPSHPHKEQGHLHLHQVLLSQFQTSTFTPPIFK